MDVDREFFKLFDLPEEIVEKILNNLNYVDLIKFGLCSTDCKVYARKLLR